MMKSEQKTQLVRRYIKAYLSLIGIFAAFVGVSVAQGAGWRPALAGMPLYVTVFVAISYRLARDIMAMGKQERERQNSLGSEANDDERS